MTKRMETAVAELEAMAAEGNRHAVAVLRQIAEETTDRHDYQEVRLAVLRARRSYFHFIDDARQEAEAVKVVRLDMARRECEYSKN